MFSAAITVIACFLILAHSLCALNGLQRHGDHVFRVAHVLLAAGAMGLIAGNLFGDVEPRWPVTSLVLGTALRLIAKDRATKASIKALQAWQRIRAGGVRI